MYSKTTQRAQEIGNLQSQVACLRELIRQKYENILAGLQEIQQLKEQHEQDQLSLRYSGASHGAGSRINMQLRWQKGNDPPFKITRYFVNNTVDTVVDGDTVYLMGNLHVYSYNTSASAWCKLPHSTHRRSSLTIVNSLLTLVVGGDRDGKTTNKL